MNDDKYLVWVYCSTFNQADYIIDTMDGFCRQETSFPFICTILDDASTDGEQEVIRKYLEDNFILEAATNLINRDKEDFKCIFARHRTNHNCYFAVLFLNYNHYSIKKTKFSYLDNFFSIKYMARCEGDDYWIDSLKLQKEVAFLEANSDYSMVYTAYRRINQSNSDVQIIEAPQDYLYYNNDCKWAILTNDIKIGTATVLYKTDVYNRIRNDFADDYIDARMADVQTWFHFARISKIHYLPDITAAYRKHEGGVTSINSIKRFEFLKNALDIHYRLAMKYDAPGHIKELIIGRFGVSLLSTGIDYRLYDKCIALTKEYMPHNRLLLVLLRMGKSILFLKPSMVKRVVLYLLSDKTK